MTNALRSVKIQLTKDDQKRLEKFYGRTLTVYDFEEAANQAWQSWITKIDK